MKEALSRNSRGLVALGLFCLLIISGQFVGCTAAPPTGLTSSASIVLSPVQGRIDEAGSSATFTVSLSSAPRAPVIVEIESSKPSEVVATPASVTFAADVPPEPQTITLTGQDDQLADGPQEAVIRVLLTSADGQETVFARESFSVINEDNEQVGFKVSEVYGNTSEAGGEAHFLVSLMGTPEADVVLPLMASSDPGEVQLSQTQLTFSVTDYLTPQKVRLVGVDDEVVDGEQRVAIILGAAVSEDARFNGLSAENASVVNLDNDRAGVVIQVLSDTTDEKGGLGFVALHLAAAPTAEVVLSGMAAQNSAEMIAPTTPLRFTPENWKVPQVLAFVGQDDDRIDGAQNVTVDLGETASQQQAFNQLRAGAVTMVNLDDDAPGAGPTVAGGEVPPELLLSSVVGTASEAGDAVAVLSFRLSRPSTLPVTVNITSGDAGEIVAEPATFTFAAGSGAATSYVIFRGVDDDVADGTVAVTVELSVVSQEPAWQEVAAKSVTVLNADDETAQLLVLQPQPRVVEAGAAQAVWVRLNRAPRQAVTIFPVSAAPARVEVAPSALTFNPTQWREPQYFTLRGDNNQRVDAPQSVAVALGPTASTDAAWDQVSIAPLAVQFVDDDVAGMEASLDGAQLSESGSSATLSVRLTAEPATPLEVLVTSSDSAEVAVTPALLTFTAENWQLAQTVQLVGQDDSRIDGTQQVTITLAAQAGADSDPAFAEVRREITVTNVDNDAAAVLTTAAAGATSESGTSTTFMVQLATAPTSEVVLASIAPRDASELAVSPTSLTFTPQNFSTPQEVTVTGVHDRIRDGNRKSYIDLGRTTSDDPLYDDLAVGWVAVINQDIDQGICPEVVDGTASAEAGYANWPATPAGVDRVVSSACGPGRQGFAVRACSPQAEWLPATTHCWLTSECPGVLPGNESQESGWANWDAATAGSVVAVPTERCAPGYRGGAERSCGADSQWLPASSSCTLIPRCPEVAAGFESQDSGWARWAATYENTVEAVSLGCKPGFRGDPRRNCGVGGVWQPATGVCTLIPHCPAVLATQESAASGFAQWPAVPPGTSDVQSTTCKEGYRGTAVRSCGADGVWRSAEGSACQPIPDCPAISLAVSDAAAGHAAWPETPRGKIDLESAVCQSGYIGYAVRSCGLDGLWQPASKACDKIADCPAVLAGQESLPTGYARWDATAPGATDVSSDRCAVGYRGGAVRSCDTLGRWLPASVACTKIPDCPAVVAGDESPISGWARWPAAAPGSASVISSECLAGYRGTAVRTCGSDGLWQDASQSCLRIPSCPHVFAGQISQESGFAEWPLTRPGTANVVSRACGVGYTGQAVRDCDADGNWLPVTDPLRRCTKIPDCPAIGAAEPATLFNGYAQWNATAPGTTAVLTRTCAPGYWGEARRDCGADGQWLAAATACTEIPQCPAITDASLQTGWAVWEATKAGEATVTSSVCASGYGGTAVRACGPDGQWEAVRVTCEFMSDCPAVVGGFESPAAGYARWAAAPRGTTAQSVGCLEGYEGSATRACGSDGVWRDATVSCTAIPMCPAVFAGDESAATGYAQWPSTPRSTTQKSSVCAIGYRGEATRVCDATGTWAAVAADQACTKVPDCPAVEGAAAATAAAGYAEWAAAPPGRVDVLSVTCASGYRGRATRSCGADGQWLPASAACTPITACPAVTAAEASLATGWATWPATAPGTLNSTAGVCLAGYTGRPQRSCNALGDWQPATQACTPLPRCAATLPDEESELGGYARWPVTDPGITVTSSECKLGYKVGSQGPATRRCNDEGQWEAASISCVPYDNCPTIYAGDADVSTGWAAWDSTTPGADAVSAGCAPGYKGQATRSCGYNGVWGPIRSACTKIKDCVAVTPGLASAASGWAHWKVTAAGTVDAISGDCAPRYRGFAQRSCDGDGNWLEATVSCERIPDCPAVTAAQVSAETGWARWAPATPGNLTATSDLCAPGYGGQAVRACGADGVWQYAAIPCTYMSDCPAVVAGAESLSSGYARWPATPRGTTAVATSSDCLTGYAGAPRRECDLDGAWRNATDGCTPIPYCPDVLAGQENRDSGYAQWPATAPGTAAVESVSCAAGYTGRAVRNCGADGAWQPVTEVFCAPTSDCPAVNVASEESGYATWPATPAGRVEVASTACATGYVGRALRNCGADGQWQAVTTPCDPVGQCSAVTEADASLQTGYARWPLTAPGSLEVESRDCIDGYTGVAKRTCNANGQWQPAVEACTPIRDCPAVLAGAESLTSGFARWPAQTPGTYQEVTGACRTGFTGTAGRQCSPLGIWLPADPICTPVADCPAVFAGSGLSAEEGFAQWPSTPAGTLQVISNNCEAGYTGSAERSCGTDGVWGPATVLCSKIADCSAIDAAAADILSGYAGWPATPAGSYRLPSTLCKPGFMGQARRDCSADGVWQDATELCQEIPSCPAVAVGSEGPASGYASWPATAPGALATSTACMTGYSGEATRECSALGVWSTAQVSCTRAPLCPAIFDDAEVNASTGYARWPASIAGTVGVESTSCLPGFTGTARRNCNSEGVWEEASPSCISVEGCPAVVAGEESAATGYARWPATASGTANVTSSECLAGYSPPALRSCGPGGVWLVASVKCGEPPGCPAISLDEASAVSGFAAWARTTPGTAVVTSTQCRPGYTGEAVRSCGEDAVWGEVTQACSVVPDCPAVISVDVTAATGWAEWPSAAPGATVTSNNCAPGYKGTATRTCGIDGLWRPENLVPCAAVTDCPAITTGTASWSVTKPGTLVATSSSCAAGYIGPAQRSCSVLGEWGPVEVECAPVPKCPAVSAAQGSEASGYAEWPETQFSTEVESTTCAAGYTGVARRFCGAAGTWLDASQSCRPIADCLAATDAGTADAGYANWDLTASGTLATSDDCAFGYTGSAVRPCNADGTWGPATLSCTAIAPCPAVPVGRESTLTGWASWPTTALGKERVKSTACAAGFQGEAIRSCQADGTWSLPLDSCDLVPQIALGDGFSCVLFTNDAVRCWGQNDYGQLGLGNTQRIGDNELPVWGGQTGINGPVRKLVAGARHVCALVENGVVRCWGDARLGQLGRGNLFTIGDDELPSSVSAVDVGGYAVDIAAGYEHTCALLEGGLVRCWGRNDYGQLGLGHTTTIGDNERPSSTAYVAVGGTAEQLALGRNHTCVRLTGGGVRCFGYNNFGQLGQNNAQTIGDASTRKPDSVPLINLGGAATAIAAGDNHTCAILDTGAVRCWGYNAAGQLGLAHTTNLGGTALAMPPPNLVLGGAAAFLDAGGNHTCVWLQTGGLRCFGAADQGQLGYGDTRTVGDDETAGWYGNVNLNGAIVRSLGLGAAHTCATLSDGLFRCWGSNATQQLGFASPAQVSAAFNGNVTRALCGDGVRNGDEQCDGQDFTDPVTFVDETCVTAGFGGGTLGCSTSCQLDYSACRAPAPCGNNLRDSGEECDGSDLGGQTCASRGFRGGNLACMNSCYFDLSGCDVTLATGAAHTCAIFPDRSLRCWGLNDAGQLGMGNKLTLGDDEFAGKSAPVNLDGQMPLQVVTGGKHTCVLVTGGRLRCFGLNNYGQLGYGHVRNLGDDEAITLTSVPAVLDAVVEPVRQIAAGESVTCAVLVDGRVRCFGRGDQAQLGLGYKSLQNIGDNELPATVGHIPVGGAVRQVVAGQDFACALLASGAVRCWGANAFGQLGLGHTQAIGDGVGETPAVLGDVQLGGPARQLVAGAQHVCALMQTGTVRCFGRGSEGQLGYGNTNHIGDNEMPIRAGEVSVGAPVSWLGAGAYHTCAVLVDGGLRCWGQANSGQLGRGDTTVIGDDDFPSTYSTVALNEGQVLTATAGSQFTCILYKTGLISCFGVNNSGQLGLGHTTNVSSAILGRLPRMACGDRIRRGDENCDGMDFTDAVTGEPHTCATEGFGSGTLKCTAGCQYDFSGCTGKPPCGNDQIDSGEECDGANLNGQTCESQGYPGGSLSCMSGCYFNYAGCNNRIANGQHFTCVLTDTGAVKCFGRNDQGQLGYGHNARIGDNETLPYAGTVDLSGAVVRQIVAGNAFACALLEGDTLLCWGDNSFGQLGYGDNTGAKLYIGDNELPKNSGSVFDPAANGTRQIATGGTHACAVLTDGRLRCFGRGDEGQLGLGSTARIGDNETAESAAVVDVGASVAQVATGQRHTCALLTSGAVRCWGNNDNGQLGYGNRLRLGDVAAEVPRLNGDVEVGGPVRQIVAGELHTCALLATGAVRCWGANNHGQLGYETSATIGDDEAPFVAGDVNLGGTAAKKLSAGWHYTCATLVDGTVRCWGRNDYRQVGEGYGGKPYLTSSYLGLLYLGSYVNEIVGAEAHSCLLLANGELRCWGTNDFGQLGLGYTGNLNFPSVQPLGLRCGDGYRHRDEDCDINDYTNRQTGVVDTCATQGLGGGTLGCLFNCRFDYTFCGPVAPCGNGQIDAGEECDGNNLNGQSCLSKGYSGGTLGCMSGCYFDYAACNNRVATGQYHSCVIATDGSVRCFGHNNQGQLGLGHTEQIGDNEGLAWAATGAVDFSGVTVRQIAAGLTHNCALLTGGAVRCWGYNAFGQLGLGNNSGNFANIGDNELPKSVATTLNSVTEPARQIATGAQHACAVLADGRLRCWGSADQQQLGCGNWQRIGDNERPDSVEAVDIGTTIRQVATGLYHTCALSANGAVRCWGYNNCGQLGYGFTQTNMSDGVNETLSSLGFVKVGGPVRQLVAGEHHTCALLRDGTIRCWGCNDRGQLGYDSGSSIGDDETPASQSTVNVGGSVQRLFAGAFHTCALLTDGALRCWGLNDAGQVGDGNGGKPILPSPTLSTSALGGTIADFSTGWKHNCILLSDGALRCWGYNDQGQLGLGRTGNMGGPYTPAARWRCWDGVRQSDEECDGDDLGGASCASEGLSAGTLRCLPTCSFDLSQCGRPLPCGNNSIDTGEECDGTQLNGQTCASKGYLSGTLACMNGCYFDYSGCSTRVAAGAVHTCVVLNDGKLRCWGHNGQGQLGLGNNQNLNANIGNDEAITSISTVNVGGSSVVQAVAGARYTCALLATGAVKCWGENNYGQLGLGTTRYWGDDEALTTLPNVLDPAAEPVRQIAAGEYHTCAVLTDGRLRCWGSADQWQLGYDTQIRVGDNETPQSISAVNVGAAVRQVATGKYHTCVLMAGGTVRCWGENGQGQLGLGNTQRLGDGRNETIRSIGDVRLGGFVRQIVAGGYHTCVLMENGQVRCWGHNANRQLGYESAASIGDDELPLMAGVVNVGGKVTRLAGGERSTCAILTDSTLRCWGYNDRGILGLGYSNWQVPIIPAWIGPLQTTYALGAKEIVMGRQDASHACALLEEDSLNCWGFNDNGQLGLGVTGDRYAPYQGYVPYR